MIAYRTMTRGLPVKDRPVPIYIEEIEVERFTEESVRVYPTDWSTGERLAGRSAKCRSRSNRFDTIHETKAAAIRSLTATWEREIQDAERRIATAREHLAALGPLRAEVDATAERSTGLASERSAGRTARPRTKEVLCEQEA